MRYVSLKQLASETMLPPKWLRKQLHKGVPSGASLISDGDGTRWQIPFTSDTVPTLNNLFRCEIR